MSVIAALLIVAVGGLIGTVGLGGFMLVPLLMLLEGATARQAVAVAAIAFLAAGLVSLALWRRRPGFALREYRSFLLGTAPGAVLGALVVGAVVDSALEVAIAIAFTVAGIAEWLGVPRSRPAEERSRTAAAAEGFATGFGSAVTGTSGPMVAMPLLAWAGLPIGQRVVVAQIAQVPIALGATIAFLSFGEVPWRLALWCSGMLCIGLAAASLITPRLGTRWLRRAAAVLMLVAAAGVVAKLHGRSI